MNGLITRRHQVGHRRTWLGRGWRLIGALPFARGGTGWDEHDSGVCMRLFVVNVVQHVVVTFFFFFEVLWVVDGVQVRVVVIHGDWGRTRTRCQSTIT